METQSGKRVQIICVEVFRNKNEAVTNCTRLMEYLKKNANENYLVIGSAYGRPKNALNSFCKLLLNENLIEHPRKTLYEICKTFIDSKQVDSLDVADMGLYYDVEHIINWLKGEKKDGKTYREAN